MRDLFQFSPPAKRECFTGAGVLVGAWSRRRALVQAPFRPQGLLLSSWLGELEAAGLLWQGRTLVLWLQAGHQLCDKSAGFLGVQVADFFWYVHQGIHSLVVALLGPFFKHASSSADFDGKLLAFSVSNELSGGFFYVFGLAR